MADIMAIMTIATIKENAMMNIFRNGFLVRKFMMVAMMTAMAVNIQLWQRGLLTPPFLVFL